MIGAFTQQIDLPQLLVAAFALFFLAVVLYIRREDKREGYPLEEAIPELGHRIVGFPPLPEPKTYERLEGGFVTLPQEYPRRELKARPREWFPGAPLYPIGDPLLAGIGPSSYALRRDEPFVMIDGSPCVEPMRELSDHTCVDPELDPRGMTVFGSDYKQGGLVKDVWFDKESKIVRYLEVEVAGVAETRLFPIFYAHIKGRAKEVRIDCITAAQFGMAPVLRRPNVVTALEEDMINGFFAGGYIYSEPLKEALL